MLRNFALSLGTIKCAARRHVTVCQPTGSIFQCSSWSQPVVTKDDFKFVEDILPRITVPEPPKHSSYPTPSGWVPPASHATHYPYYVRRTRFHQLPVYLEISDGGTRHLTTVNKVEGDIWKFEEDLKSYLEELKHGTIYTSVDELCCKVKVRGSVIQHIKDFLLEKGF